MHLLQKVLLLENKESRLTKIYTRAIKLIILKKAFIVINL